MVVEQLTDALGKLHFAVVLRGVADHAAGIREAPEGARVAGDAVEDLEWDAVGVPDIRRLDAFRYQLGEIACAEIRTEIALVCFRVAGKLSGVDLAWCAYAEMHILHGAAL